MNASGGGGGGGINFTPEIEPEIYNCSKVNMIVIVLGPNINLLVKLKLGDDVDIDFDNKRSIVAKKNNEIIGNLIHKDINELVKCIKKGYKYKGIIVKLDGADCEIKITNEK